MIANRQTLPIDVKDFNRLRSLIRAFAASAYNVAEDELTDTELLSFLIDLLSMFGDSFYREAERAAGEGSMATAVEPQSILDHALYHYGYVPQAAVASQYTMQAAVASGVSFILPKGAQFVTEPRDGSAPQYFETLSDTVKPLGATVLNFTVRHGLTRTSGPYNAAGTPGEKYLLPLAGVVVDEISVTVNGETWTRVSSFAQSLPTFKHYRVIASELVPGQRRYWVVFGDGSQGRKLVAGEQVEIQYVVGGGSISNVGLSKITKLSSSLVDSSGQAVVMTPTNTAQTVRGVNEETVDVVRVKAPMMAAMHAGVVSREDYVAAACNVGAVRAVAITSNEYPSLMPNVVAVYALSDLTDPLTTLECDSLKALLLAKYRTNGTAKLFLLPSQIEEASITIMVNPEPGASALSKSALQAQLQTFVNGYFSLNSVVGPIPRYTVDIGKPVALSPLISILNEHPGVDQVDLPLGLAPIQPTSAFAAVKVQATVIVL